MEKTRTFLTTLGLCLATTPAFAETSTHRVYSSGILVLVFLGFCALVVVAQLIPAIISLAGMIKGAAKSTTTEAARVKTH